MTGHWGQCAPPGCGRGGQQHRAVWCFNEQLGGHVHDNHCDRDLKPHSKQDCFRLCYYHRYQYHWKTTSWSECRLFDSDLDSNASHYFATGDSSHTRHYGLQRRHVTCVSNCEDQQRMQLAHTEHNCGHFERQPPTEQLCRVNTASQDCISTEFGAWTRCTYDEYGCPIIKYRTRWRQVRYHNSSSSNKSGNISCMSLLNHDHYKLQSVKSTWFINYAHLKDQANLNIHNNKLPWTVARSGCFSEATVRKIT